MTERLSGRALGLCGAPWHHLLRGVSAKNKDLASLWQNEGGYMWSRLCCYGKPCLTAKANASPGPGGKGPLPAAQNHFTVVEHQDSFPFALGPSLWALRIACCSAFFPHPQHACPSISK